ncbi:glutathione S-transferase [Xylaria sp. FL0064]|nr:glutathione S-transferase [Xylaria sp. FL0064]
MAQSTDLPIVLYHYDLSPYARRLIWYLTLRKIPYSQCIQPRMLPRPDLSLLGVSYRRIPVLSIGRDVYLDTRLIIQKLETLYPASAAHPGISGRSAENGKGNPEHTALEQLISARTIEGDLFSRAIQCFPPNMFAADTAFLRDRTALLTGVDNATTPNTTATTNTTKTKNQTHSNQEEERKENKPAPASSPLSPESMTRQRPAALAIVRRWVRWLEEGLLSDGRTWILDSNARGAGPSLADIEAIWVLHWIAPALPPSILSPESSPRVAAWMKRFRGAVSAATEQAPTPARLKGEEAAKLIVGSPFAEPEGEVLKGVDPFVDAAGLVEGKTVRVWPTDYGFSHKDVGKLVAVDDVEFVIESDGAYGSVRIHAPRHGFTIAADEGSVVSKI